MNEFLTYHPKASFMILYVFGLITTYIMIHKLHKENNAHVELPMFLLWICPFLNAIVGLYVVVETVCDNADRLYQFLKTKQFHLPKYYILDRLFFVPVKKDNGREIR
jgi:hypothetical protein